MSQPDPDLAKGQMEFKRMLQQAAAIKQKQVLQARQNFEKMPEHVQHSLFFRDPVSVVPRSKPVMERLALATKGKEIGNKLFVSKKYPQAIVEYERSLALFQYFTSSDPEWQKNGIKDENLTLTHDTGETEEEKKKILEFETSCVNNIAACFLLLQEYGRCVQVCSLVLYHDPNNIKALQRRAKALLSPASSGGAEMDIALKDLQKAQKLNPQDQGTARLLAKVLKDKKEQAVHDKKQFSGLFNRGEVVSQDPAQIAQQKAQAAQEHKNEFERRLYQLTNMMRSAEQAGKTKEAQQLKHTVAGMQAALQKLEKSERAVKAEDFRNPTRDMIEDAKRFGLDLGDPRIVHELERLSKQREDGGLGNDRDVPGSAITEESVKDLKDGDPIPGIVKEMEGNVNFGDALEEENDAFVKALKAGGGKKGSADGKTNVLLMLVFALVVAFLAIVKMRMGEGGEKTEL